MARCPTTIDDALVILAVALDPARHSYTGSTRLFVGSEQTWFHGLAIARYGRDANDGDVCLFYCDETWETENDCSYSTIEEAVADATRQFGVSRRDWEPVSWPFDQTQDTACISTLPVFAGGHPMLHAQHFEDDHSWVFSCGTTTSADSTMLVAMDEAFHRDPTLAFISDLPPRWSADRADIDSPWIRRQTPA